ncbi:MAG: hypothetical protein U0935_22935 [Pirellulales bacterium]
MLDIARAVRRPERTFIAAGHSARRFSPTPLGPGEPALKILRDTGRGSLPVVTEVMDPQHVELVERYADMIQIGARNAWNFSLLTEVGRTRKPVLLKRE